MENDLLSLETNILRPLDEASQVTLRLNVLAFNSVHESAFRLKLKLH